MECGRVDGLSLPSARRSCMAQSTYQYAPCVLSSTGWTQGLGHKMYRVPVGGRRNGRACPSVLAVLRTDVSRRRPCGLFWSVQQKIDEFFFLLSIWGAGFGSSGQITCHFTKVAFRGGPEGAEGILSNYQVSSLSPCHADSLHTTTTQSGLLCVPEVAPFR